MIKIGDLLRKLWFWRSCFNILPPGALTPQGIEGAMERDMSKHWCTLQWCASRGWFIAHENWTSCNKITFCTLLLHAFFSGICHNIGYINSKSTVPQRKCIFINVDIADKSSWHGKSRLQRNSLLLPFFSFTKLTLCDTYMRQWTGYSLNQVMVCRLFGFETLPEPMINHCRLNP